MNTFQSSPCVTVKSVNVMYFTMTVVSVQLIIIG